jgi:tetratricopeptide (TPR) repeat protein
MLWLLASAASAQKESAPPAGYSQLVERALSEFDAQNYFEARSLFTRAHALYPNARTLRGLGVVEFALRNCEVAADYLARALSSNERPLSGELRATTEKSLTQSRDYLAHVAVTVTPADAAARVLVDGEHFCAIQNGGMWCWGDNRYGQAGQPLAQRNAPFGVAVP